MLRRFYLISMLVAVLGAGAAVAATVMDKKDKQKDKFLFHSGRLITQRGLQGHLF